MKAEWRHLLLVPALMLVSQASAQGTDPAAGNWRGANGPDTASQLELGADGHFRWFLSAGALDEGAEGRWVREGAMIRLFTEPKPKPPTLTLAKASPKGKDDAALFLFVAGPEGSPDTNSAGATGPDTNGIAGVDFHIEMDRGDPLEGYTQYYGWSTGSLEGRTPLWVQLVEPINGIASDRVAIPAGTKTLRFTLQPNDLGVASFDGSNVVVEGDALTLTHRLGALRYVRAGK
ncbi:hypothetical protein BH10PSE13_BH10PSE13_03930 [soil metagenome]